jgi:hypothetical protein
MGNIDIEQELKKIRRKRWQLWSVFISYLPAIGAALSFSADNTGPILVATLWVIAAGIAGVRVSMSRCPQCGNLFHMQGVSTSWGRSCRHCKLSL